MTQYNELTKANPFQIFCWCLFDWAHSAFPAVIITFIFGTYFVRSVAENTILGTAYWGWMMGVSGLTVAILSPILGSIADYTGRRKPWLGIFTLINILLTGLLFFTKPNPSYICWALICLYFANIFYEFVQVFYNAMMTSIAPPKRIGRISGWGWGLG
jgi:UMF1 family MFS transporter